MLSAFQSENESNLATVEQTAAASKAYAVGDYLVYQGTLYRVTSAIDPGGAIRPQEPGQTGGNCASTNSGEELNKMFFGSNSIHLNRLSVSTAGTSIDSIVDYIADNYMQYGMSGLLYFSADITGGITNPNTGSNAAFIYGMINNTKTYGWVIYESFDARGRGKRKGASTFTFS